MRAPSITWKSLDTGNEEKKLQATIDTNNQRYIVTIAYKKDFEKNNSNLEDTIKKIVDRIEPKILNDLIGYSVSLPIPANTRDCALSGKKFKNWTYYKDIKNSTLKKALEHLSDLYIRIKKEDKKPPVEMKLEKQEDVHSSVTIKVDKETKKQTPNSI